MFCKLDIHRKSIATLALSWDNHQIVARYLVNRDYTQINWLEMYKKHRTRLDMYDIAVENW